MVNLVLWVFLKAKLEKKEKSTENINIYSVLSLQFWDITQTFSFVLIILHILNSFKKYSQSHFIICPIEAC